MSTPEPVDERPAGAVEIRGGDRDEDFITFPAFAKGGLVLADGQESCGPDCTCQDEDAE
jgi:hypothetical protein